MWLQTYGWGGEPSLYQRGPGAFPAPGLLTSSELLPSSPRESHQDLAPLGAPSQSLQPGTLHYTSIYPVASRGPNVKYIPSLLLTTHPGSPRRILRLPTSTARFSKHSIMCQHPTTCQGPTWETAPRPTSQGPLGFHHL